MDIKDAEYLDYLELNSKILAETWELEAEAIASGVWSSTHNQSYVDDKIKSKSFICIGTQAQIDEEKENTDWIIDEVYEYKVEPKGSYWHGIYGSKADIINEEVEANLKRYKEIYKANGNKLIKIRTQ